MDTTAQIVLVIMIVVLGSTLTVVGIMLFLVLKDFRESIKHLNAILTDFELVGQRIATGTEYVDEVLVSIKDTVEAFRTQAATPMGSVFGVINLIRSLMGNDKGGGRDG